MPEQKDRQPNQTSPSRAHRTLPLSVSSRRSPPYLSVSDNPSPQCNLSVLHYLENCQLRSISFQSTETNSIPHKNTQNREEGTKETSAVLGVVAGRRREKKRCGIERREEGTHDKRHALNTVTKSAKRGERRRRRQHCACCNASERERRDGIRAESNLIKFEVRNLKPLANPDTFLGPGRPIDY